MAGGITVDFKGMTELSQNLRALSREMPSEVAAALYKEAQIEMTEAKKRTPVDTGALRNSGRVEKPKVTEGEISVRMAFGGLSGGAGTGGQGVFRDTSHYAIHVHENLDAFHKVGQAKYLESVLNESGKYLPARVGNRIRDAIDKRTKRR